MQRKRNGFLTFCFACIPGAGQMFLGFFKEGTSLMLMFLGMISLGGFLNIEALFIIIPVIWFYAFFDALNKNSMPDDEFQQLKDHYLLVNGFDDFKGFSFSKYRIAAAVLIILFGLTMLFNNIIDFLFMLGINISYETHELIFSIIPQIIIAALIIALGLHLIIGKKHSLEQDMADDENIFSSTESDGDGRGEF